MTKKPKLRGRVLLWMWKHETKAYTVFAGFSFGMTIACLLNKHFLTAIISWLAFGIHMHWRSVSMKKAPIDKYLEHYILYGELHPEEKEEIAREVQKLKEILEDDRP